VHIHISLLAPILFTGRAKILLAGILSKIMHTHFQGKKVLLVLSKYITRQGKTDKTPKREKDARKDKNFVLHLLRSKLFSSTRIFQARYAKTSFTNCEPGSMRTPDLQGSVIFHFFHFSFSFFFNFFFSFFIFLVHVRLQNKFLQIANICLKT
jgi:hypothetical protein